MVAIALVVVLILGGGGAAFVLTRPPPIGARLAVKAGTRVDVHQPVVVRFDRRVDLSRVRVGLTPATRVSLRRGGSELRVAPVAAWRIDTRYRLRLEDVGAQGAAPLQRWTASFRTQIAFPATFESAGRPLGARASLSPFAPLAIVFGSPVRPQSVRLTWAGKPLPAQNLTWQSDDRGAAITIPSPQLGTAASLALETATSQLGQQVSNAASVQLTEEIVEPAARPESNGSTPASPSLVVVANDPGARPQAGLQQADIVFEYLTEYGVSRMTAVYFGNAPGRVGPVRSCRPINLYIGFGFDGHTLCSGASAGTLHYIWAPGHTLPGVMWDWEPRGRHFFVDSSRASPDDVFTSGRLAAPLRSRQPLATPGYVVDAAHAPQAPAGGTAAGSISVPQDSVSWTYDAAAHAYLRSNNGAASVDAGSGAQLQATNVVVMDVPSHLTNWIEDENGGAHAVWYTMLGSGPAQVYMDGRAVPATWHMGEAPAQNYYDNNDPVWFTGSSGQVIRLDTGLTWINVVGSQV